MEEKREMPKPGDHLTGEAISAIFSSMIDSGGIFLYSTWEELARAFLAPFFTGDARRCPISELRECYLFIPGAITHIPIPEKAEKFSRFIGGKFLGLSALPRDSLLEVYRDASKDLAEIEANIKECERRAQEQSGGKPDPEKDSWVKVYSYYEEMNRQAREEVVEFLIHGVQEEALWQSQSGGSAVIEFHVPYHYRAVPDLYHPDDFSEVSHKFMQEPVSAWDEWKRCYAEDRTAFSAKLAAYMTNRRPWKRIRRDVESHHRLNARREILLATLDAYERSQWSVFATLAVVQIEGLFLDYCEDLGVGEGELTRSSLPIKLHAIRKTKGSYSRFPYYAYRLPVIRNHLAHGRILQQPEEAAERAHLLLLDLLDVCQHVMEPELLVNVQVNRIREASVPPSPRDALAMEFIAMRLGEQPPPAFYNIDEHWRAMRERADSTDVAEFIEKLRIGIEEWDNQGLLFLGILKALVVNIKKRSANKERWKDTLKNLPSQPNADPSTLGRDGEWELFRSYLEQDL